MDNIPTKFKCPKRMGHMPKRPDKVISYVSRCKIIEEVEPHQIKAAKLAAHKESDIYP
jgi:hypothetical protein